MSSDVTNQPAGRSAPGSSGNGNVSGPAPAGKPDSALGPTITHAAESRDSAVEGAQFLERTTAALPPPGFAEGITAWTAKTAAQPSWEGQRIGRFCIRQRLGEGAFGIVYRAHDAHLDREVALKVAKRGTLDSPQRVERFLREARAAAGLRHPHIVPVHDAGSDGELQYIAAALIDGRPLSAAIAGRPMELNRAVTIVRKLCEAVNYAHTQGIVHRDIKPANVLLDRRDEPMLMDFGLAARAGSERLTADGAILGTPAYMAPEQAAGHQGEARPAADQYSLGVVLYELLTGRVPFTGTTASVVFNHVNTTPPSPGAFRANLPRDLETICLKAMAKTPADRYADCQTLADDLRRWQEGQPIQARPLGLLERSWRWCKREPVVALLAVLLTISLVAVAVVQTVNASRLAASVSRETSAREKAQEERNQADTARAVAKKQAEAEKQARLAAERALYLNRVSLADREWWLNNPHRAEQILATCSADLRNWEWNYLKRVCQGGRATLNGSGSFYSVAYSRDGKCLAGAVAKFNAYHVPAEITVWDTATNKEIAHLAGKSGIFSVAFDPGKDRLAAASADGTVAIWDLATGKQILTLLGHKDWVRSVAFNHDGKLLASAGSHGLVKVWDGATGKEVRSLRVSGDPVFAVAFSPDGQRLAACTALDWNQPLHAGQVKIWEAATGKELVSFRDQGVFGLAFSPDGARLATCGGAAVRLWNSHTGKELATLRPKSSAVTTIAGVAFSPDGRRIAAACNDHSLVLWNPDSGEELLVQRGHFAPVWGVAFHPRGDTMASAGFDSTVRIWDVAAETGCRTLYLPGRFNYGLAFSADSKRLAVAVSDAAARIFDLDTGKEAHLLRGHKGRVRSVAFSADGDLLFTGGYDQTVKIWTAATGKEVRTLRGHNRTVCGVASSRDGRLLASAGGDLDNPTQPGEVKIWDMQTGSEIKTLSGTAGGFFGVAFSPDGKRLAAAGGDKAVTIWDTDIWQVFATLRGHADWITAVAFSPDGKLVASASRDKTVKLWDIAGGKEPVTLRGHAREVWGVAFNRDGSRVVSAAADRAVILWDVETAQEALTLRGHTAIIYGLALSPDGRRIASGSWGEIRIRDSARLEQ